MQQDTVQPEILPQSTVTSDMTATPPAQKRNNLVVIILIIIIVILAVALILVTYQSSQLRSSTTQPIASVMPTPLDNLSPSPIASQENDQWATASDLGFTFEYPTGWHVADIWPNDFRNGISLVINPKPISTAPRGGPLGTFTIRAISGQPDPEVVFQQEISSFTEQNYDNLQTQILQSSIGEIHYYKGNIAGEFMKGQPIEAYIFITPLKSDDKLNRQVVVATTLSEEEGDSEKFRHIMMSFKLTNP